MRRLLLAAFVVLLPAAVIGMPDTFRIPIVREHGKGTPQVAARFSHWVHNQSQCYSCHPSIFPQRKKGFTHDDMDNGKFCGACHNGKISFSPDDADITCEVCHR